MCPTQAQLAYIGNPITYAATISFDVEINPAAIPAGDAVTFRAWNSGAPRDVGGNYVELNYGTPSGAPTCARFGDTTAPCQPFNADSSFHNYRFVRPASGQAAWYRDGILQSTSDPGVTTTWLTFTAESGGSSCDGVATIDNVVLTQP
jgi:hypothetical protein